MSATPIADAIRRIEDRIGDERYWTKFDIVDVHGRSCLVGAAADVERARRRSGVPMAGLFRFLNDIAADFTADAAGLGFRAMEFNDDFRTTHADVMLFLATALDVAEAEGL